MSLVQWLSSTYQVMHWATCHPSVGSLKISHQNHALPVLIHSCLQNATPVAEYALARCLFGLLLICGQKGATPVTPQVARPLHITLPRILGADASNAQDTQVHTPVALHNSAYTLNRLVQRPWLPSSLGRCIILLCFFHIQTTPTPLPCIPLGRWLVNSYLFAPQLLFLPINSLTLHISFMTFHEILLGYNLGCYISPPLKKISSAKFTVMQRWTLSHHTFTSITFS